MLPSKLTFVDVETSGCRWSDRVIEIGMVRVEDNQVVRTFKSLINPHGYVSPEILDMTGIKASELERAPSFYELRDEIWEILEDCLFVAHNVRFDYSFIRNEFKRFDRTFKARQLCTVKLSRNLFPEHRHHNLDSLIERYGFQCESRHRAYDDAHVLWQFYQHLQEHIDGDRLKLVFNKLLKTPTTPIKIEREILDNLPDSPGVYIFYGEKGMPLYVGKSVNIRDRVLSHFSADHLSSTEMAISQQVEQIETIETAGELGALLKEASLIKSMQPLYNRMLRHSHKLLVLKKKKVGDYESVVLEEAGNIDPNNMEEILGIFRNKKQAKQFLISVAREFELCEKLLGVDTTLTNCFNYRLGKCRGACSGKELPVKYNFRFLNAFSKTKLRAWPFEGPIMIREKGEDGKEEGFVVDKWCFVGRVKSEEEVSRVLKVPRVSRGNVIARSASDEAISIDNATPHPSPLPQGARESSQNDILFDLDTYKILVRYFLNGKNQKNIQQLKSFNEKKSARVSLDDAEYPEVYT